MLDDIDAHADDLDWLMERLDNTHTVFKRALQTLSTFERAMEVYPKVAMTLLRHDDDHVRWRKVTWEGWNMAQSLNDNQMQTRLLTMLIKAHAQEDDGGRSHTAAKLALSRIGTHADQAALLEVHIQFIEALTYRKNPELWPQVAAAAFRLANLVDDRRLRARLHQVYAYSCGHYSNNEGAIEHGQLAYAYWRQLGDGDGMSRSAFAVATGYLWVGRNEQADRWMEIAAQTFKPGRSPREDAYFAYMQGQHAYVRARYESAERWLREAMVQYKKSSLPYHLAATQQTLALTSAHLKKIKAARILMAKAASGWEALGNPYAIADARMSQGYIEAHAGRVSLAKFLIDEAEALTKAIEDETRRSELWSRIQTVRTEIMSGRYGDPTLP